VRNAKLTAGRGGRGAPFLAERPAASSLARAYLVLDRAADAVRTLAPFIGPEMTPAYETHVLAAEGLKRAGEFARAIEILDRAVSHYGVNAVLMNSLGECYEGLGKAKEALAAFEKSLELSPDQPQVRMKVEELKKRK